MIKIVVSNDQISINGHSGYEEIGKDIVCSAVSSMVITTVNALIRIDSESILYTEDDGVVIKILKRSDVITKLIDNLIDLLLKLEQQYPEYIKIRRC